MFRIVSSSSRDLAEERREGNLREDLFHRLNVVPLEVPGLSERREDIPALVDHFIAQISVTLQGWFLVSLEKMPWRFCSPMNGLAMSDSCEILLNDLMILSEGDADTVITAEMLPEELGGSVNLNPDGSGGEHLMSSATS